MILEILLKWRVQFKYHEKCESYITEAFIRLLIYYD